MNEVVVTAMGIKKERKALGYSVTELNAQELMKNKIPMSLILWQVRFLV